MLPKVEHLPVNWVDGMKIARRHFSDFEHFVTDHVRDASAVNLLSSTYGLLLSDAPPFNLQVIIDQNENIQVRLSNCRAITGSGGRVELIDRPVELSTSLQAVLDKYNMPRSDDLKLLIVLTVDPFRRTPEGQPANNEPFPRPPFTLPTYQLTIVPNYQTDTTAVDPNAVRPSVGYVSPDFESYHLVVGQLNGKFGVLTNDESYIPACSALGAHSGLLAWADRSQKLFAEVQRDAVQIVAKVIRKRRTDQAFRAGALAEMIRVLAEEVAQSLDDVLNHLHFGGREQAPITYLRYIVRATRQLKTTLDCLCEPDKNSASSGREQVLPYFQSWTNLEPALVEKALVEVITKPYQHAQLQPYTVAIDRCWGMIQQIFRKMTELEYIGQENTDYNFDTQRRSTHVSEAPNQQRVLDPFNNGYSFQ
ncbi:hypothetical protein ACAW74_23370 [Fibrella sp. WM1]|uniref:hypothetical protein n=1 Tax=Fibrella musci TaxID=3242485 RepID=UPI003522DB19